MANMNEPLTLKAGCYYRTRDGRKAYVAAVGNPFDSDDQYPALGWCDGCDRCWTASGRYMDEREDNSSDLIAEWREPRVFEMYVTFFEQPDGNGKVCTFTSDHPTQIPYIPHRVLAKAVVKTTEGDGL